MTVGTDAVVALAGGKMAERKREPLLRAVPANVDPATGEIIDPATEAPTAPNLPVEFWQARAELTHVRQAADARLIAPDALLGCLLARLTLYVDPGVRLPPIIGGYASLNLAVAPIATTGLGKSAGNRVSHELLPPLPDNAATMPLGSGEGIAEAFMGEVTVEDPDRPRKTIRARRQVRQAVLFTQDEGQAMLATGLRSGATILETIRRAAFGEDIGAKNASADRTRIVEAGNYRAAFIVGFQPEHATGLLDDAAGGTPQRFIFVAAGNPDMPTDHVAWPGPLPWKLPSPMPAVIDVPAIVAEEIRRDHIAKARGEVTIDQLDSHRNLNREKVAALLAIFNGRTTIDTDDWHLAGMFIDASDRVRDGIELAAQQRARRAEVASTARQVRRAAELDRSTDERALDVVVKAIARHVHKHAPPDGCKRRCITQAPSGKYRSIVSIDEAIAVAEAHGWIITDGDSFRPGQARPA